MQSNPGHLIRRANRGQILALLAERAQFRSELCRATGLTGAAVSRITRELIDAGLVQESVAPPLKKAAGRRSSMLSIAPGGAYVLAFTLSANRMEVALYNARQQQIGLREITVQPHEPADTVLHRLTAAARELIQDSTVPSHRLLGAGVSIAVGNADAISTEGCISSDVLGWQNVPVAAVIEKALLIPVTVQPRAISLLRAEMSSGDYATSSRLGLINIGVGMGAAVFSKDVKSHYNGGLVGLAHIRHSLAERRCHCGRLGCLEMCATGVAVVAELYGNSIVKNAAYVDLALWLVKAQTRANQGDRQASDAYFRAGEHMATGIDTLQALMSPDQLLLAGTTGRQPDYVAGVRHGLQKLGSPLPVNQIGISETTSSDAAACSALAAFLYSAGLQVLDAQRESKPLQTGNQELAS
ncbi:MAG: ROK family transcriptional regulator [Gammaproteobacteria bacterium]|nr:ROK family transcriptional regulator [Gammaproteobacteria bacterium]